MNVKCGEPQREGQRDGARAPVPSGWADLKAGLYDSFDR